MVTRRRFVQGAAGLLLPAALPIAQASLITQSGPRYRPAAGGEALSHGDTFTLTGTGVASASAVVVYDDFSGGALGQSINGAAATIGTWTNDIDVSTNPLYSNAQTRGVHTRVSNHRYSRSPELYNVGLYKNWSGTPQARMYLDWWIYMTRDVDGERSRNHKIFRAYPPDSDEGAEYDSFSYHTTVCLALGSGGGAFGEAGNNYSDLGPDSLGAQFVQLPFDQWCHLQTAAYINASGGWFWMQDHLMYVNRSGVNATDGVRQIGRVRLNHYLGTEVEGPCPQTVGFNIYGSCIYVAHTWRRVEAGNASTYGNCTIREIQPYSSWSGGNVQGTFNRGLLQPGQAWFFVFDEDAANSPTYTEEFEVAA